MTPEPTAWYVESSRQNVDAHETPVDGRRGSPSDGDAAFPWRAGETVAPPWRVRSVRSGRPLVVMLERAAGQWAELTLTPSPGRAAFGAFGLAGVAVTHRSKLPAPAFAAAARALLDRIASHAEGDAGQFLDRFATPRAVCIELPSRAGIGELRAQIDADDDAPVSIVVRAGGAEDAAIALLDHCRSRGATDARLTLVGASIARPTWLRRLAPFASLLTVELVLDTLAAAKTSADLAFEQLGSTLAILRKAGIATRVMLELDQSSTGDLVQITRLAALVATQDAGPLDVAILDAERAELLGRRSASLSSLRPLLETAARARHLLVVHCSDGRPSCLFPAATRAPVAPGERAFGSQCATCSERPECTGVTKSYARTHGTDELVQPGGPGAHAASAQPLRIDWHDQVRLLLVDKPGVRLTLADVMPADELPRWKCTLPWKRLETNSVGAYGPCCADYRQLRWIAAPGAAPETLWNDDHMRAMRRALATDGHPSTCLESCPVLAAGSETAGKTRLVGGSAAAVESQIQLAEDMLAGREQLRSPPMQVCIATTSHCNYDCVMCIADRNGPDDELPSEVYASLTPWLDRLLVLDANGGEPLASKTFRAFLDHTDFARYPQLGVHLTTNGSYLTPAQLDRYDRIPFSSLTISLNAVTPETYLAVNRGLPWARARDNLDALLRAEADGRMSCHIRYSMVVLRANLHEVEAFAELAARDGVGVRYLLPTGNRHGQSTMTDADTMLRARQALASVQQRLEANGLRADAAEIAGLVRVIDQRRSAGILRPL